jgi:hypothetical protein
MLQQIYNRFNASALLMLFLLLSCGVRANVLAPSHFLMPQHNKLCLLPQGGKVTLFFLPLSPPALKCEWHYLSALSNCLPQCQLAVYYVALDSTPDIVEDLVMIIPQSDIFDPMIAQGTAHGANIVLLVDKNGGVVYVGPLGSPEKFSSILRRLGLDFSVRQHEMAALLSTDTRIVNAFSDRQLTLSDLQANSAYKIFLFYRSLCTPCGEYTLIRELYELVKKNSTWNVSIYLVFRQYDQSEADIMQEVLGQFEIMDCIYIMQNMSSAMERYFLAGNPYIAAFAPDNTFIQARIGNKMSRGALERFLKRIIK